MASESLVRLHTSIDDLLEGPWGFSSTGYVWSFEKAINFPCRVRLTSASLHSSHVVLYVEWLVCSPPSSATSSQMHTWTCPAMAGKEGLWVEWQKWWVHRRLGLSDSHSQSKAGLGKAYGKDALIKMEKEAVEVQEGREELIYDEVKAADLKEIIILL